MDNDIDETLELLLGYLNEKEFELIIKQIKEVIKSASIER